MRIITLVDGGDELLISSSTPDTGTTRATTDPLAPVFRVAATQCSLTRVRRWHDERTVLRAYLSNDGAIMLADPMLGGNAACEPSISGRRISRSEHVAAGTAQILKLMMRVRFPSPAPAGRSRSGPFGSLPPDHPCAVVDLACQ
jgi:hypothetical protein